MAKMSSLDDLFVHLLRDVLYAERQITRALPKMARKASSPELRQAFEKHLEETHGQIDRLQKIFEMMDKAPRAVKCDAMVGMISEAEDVMEDCSEPPTCDAGMIAAAQAVEHYEIARYGTLREWARELGHNDAVKLLEETLKEEHATDKLLSELASERLNKKAA